MKNKMNRPTVKAGKKVVLAFSGGLDTSYCAVYLSKQLGLEVHAVIVNTGGFSEQEVAEIKNKAQLLGVSSFICLDQVKDFYNKVVKYLIFGNVLKNSTYPLSVSAERITQASAIASYAKKTKADFIAHGSTGAGNDQVRFDAMFHILVPEIEIITPIRDNRLSREEEIQFLNSNGIEINTEKVKYSINKGLWGTSVGGKETLTSHEYLPDEAFPHALTEEKEKEICIHFKKGEICIVNDTHFEHPAQAIQYIESLAAPFAIGRDVHVGDTIIGIKGRVGFEAAAALIIIKAHHALEKHTLSKYQMTIKEQLSSWYGNWLHEGLYLDPVMRDIESFLANAQEKVSGQVFVKLLPYRFIVKGISSPHDLMSNKFGSYGEMNNTWTGDDVKGFTKIISNPMNIYYQINKDHENA